MRSLSQSTGHDGMGTGNKAIPGFTCTLHAARVYLCESTTTSEKSVFKMAFIFLSLTHQAESYRVFSNKNNLGFVVCFTELDSHCFNAEKFPKTYCVMGLWKAKLSTNT